MIFKKIGNMENVEVICHYLQLATDRSGCEKYMRGSKN